MNIVKLVLKGSIFYTLIKLVIFLIIRSSGLVDFVYYHPANGNLWIFLFYPLPFLTGLLISYKLKSKFLINLGKLFFPLFLVLSVIGYGYNRAEWGYLIKRPSVFSEVKSANKILSITRLGKKFDENYLTIRRDSIFYSKNQYIPDFYYSDFERPFIVFENIRNSDNLWLYESIANNSELKLNQNEILEIENLILTSTFLETPEKGYEESGNRYSIQAIEFIPKTQPNNSSANQLENKHLLVSVKSGEVSNDHYPRYEFLIEDSKLIKKQKYFVDIAGLEGAEYSFFSPIPEVLLLFLCSILLGIYNLIFKLRKTKSLK